VLSRTPSKIARSTPRRGEHTEEVLREIGIDPASLTRMKEAGVY
jgi:formyl-CoA transferase